MNALKIVKLGAENVKRLKAVEIIPAGNTVTISGKNDQGKTSILDAIEYALGGSKAICEEPIRKGQAKARIVCDLGEIVVERKFNAASGDSTLTVRGKKYKPATVVTIYEVGVVEVEIATGTGDNKKIKRQKFAVKDLRRSEPPKEVAS